MKMTVKKKRALALEQHQQTIVAFLIGRTIRAVDLQPFDDGRGETGWKPHITLDDGRVLSFNVQETEVGQYGTELYLAGIEGAAAPTAPAVTPAAESDGSYCHDCGRPVAEPDPAQRIVRCADCRRYAAL